MRKKLRPRKILSLNICDRLQLLGRKPCEVVLPLEEHRI